jgi:hypothetical protein
MPIFRELSVNLESQVQFECDLEQNSFWNLTLASKVNL